MIIPNDLRDEPRTAIELFLARALAVSLCLGLAAVFTAGCEIDLGEHAGDDGSGEERSANNDSDDAEAPAEGEQEREEEEEEEEIPKVDADGCTRLPINDGGGGFVSNPDNSRGTLKFVLPVAYRGNVRSMIGYSDGGFSDRFTRAMPDEHDGRPRFYGSKDINRYPDNLRVVVDLTDGTCRSFTIPDPQRRYD